MTENDDDFDYLDQEDEPGNVEISRLPVPRARSRRERPGLTADAPVLIESSIVQRDSSTAPVVFGQEVIGYARFSTGMQKKGYSIETQRRGIEAYCRKHGLRLVAFFTDEGRTGRTANRKGMREAVGFMDKKPGLTMVLFNMTRFSREIDVFLELEMDVRATQGRIVSAKTGNHRRDAQVQEAVDGMVDHPPPIPQRARQRSQTRIGRPSSPRAWPCPTAPWAAPGAAATGGTSERSAASSAGMVV